MKIPADTNTNDARFSMTVRRIVVPHNMSFDDVLVAGNWSHIAAKIARDDELIVVPEDRAWRLHLYVTETGPGYVKSVVLHQWKSRADAGVAKPEDARMEVPEGYRVDHTPKTGWRAFTTDPMIEISRGSKSHNDAVRAAIAHAAKATAVAA